MINKCCVYLAQSMTGYEKHEQVQLAMLARGVFNEFGLDVVSPVLEEGIKDEVGVLDNTLVDLNWKWKDIDKPALKYKCFVICVLNADNKSFGCEREYMLMRGCYWKPVVIVSPKHAGGYSSIANLEDDYIAGTVEEAAAFISGHYGKFWDRRLWQFRMYKKSFLGWLIIHLKGLLL